MGNKHKRNQGARVANAADPKQVRDANREDRWDEELEENDLLAIMSEKTGRRFMWRLLDTCGVYRLSFTGNSETFFNEGARNVGLRYLNDLNRLCPDLYHQMILEKQEADRKTHTDADETEETENDDDTDNDD